MSDVVTELIRNGINGPNEVDHVHHRIVHRWLNSHGDLVATCPTTQGDQTTVSVLASMTMRLSKGWSRATATVCWRPERWHSSFMTRA